MTADAYTYAGSSGLRICVNCKFMGRHLKCGHPSAGSPPSLVTGIAAPLSCETMRSSGGECGPTGVLWEARPDRG